MSRSNKSKPKKTMFSKLAKVSGEHVMNIESIISQTKAEETQDVAKVTFGWNDDVRGYQLIKTIRTGLTYEDFEKATSNIPLNEKDWSIILNINTRTLERYKKDNKRFPKKQSENIIKTLQLMHYGFDVFGDPDSFNKWLVIENISLGGITPKALLDTSFGLGMLKDALGRIEHGILA